MHCTPVSSLRAPKEGLQDEFSRDPLIRIQFDSSNIQIKASWHGRGGGYRMRSSLPQIKYRGRGEIGRVYLPSQMERSLLYNFVRDGRQSERWWAMGMHPPTLTRLG